MSVEELIVALASAVAVAALILIARGLGFRSTPRIESEEAARALIAEHEPDVRAADILLASDGAAALARLSDGRIAIVRRMGDRFAVRTLPPSALAVTSKQGALTIRFADLGFPALKLPFDGPAPAWLPI